MSTDTDGTRHTSVGPDASLIFLRSLGQYHIFDQVDQIIDQI